MGQVTADRRRDLQTEELKIVWRIEDISEDCLGRLSAADTKPGFSCTLGGAEQLQGGPQIIRNPLLGPQLCCIACPASFATLAS